TQARVIAAFDERTEEWVAMRVDACEDTRVRGELTPQIMDLRMACLDQRLREMDTTLGVLTEARSETVDNAIQLISELPRNERCSDLARLEADAAHAPPPDLGPRIAELRQDLVRVTALSEAGEFARAEEEGQRVLGEARLVGWDPVIAEALLRRARTQVGLGDFRKARDALFEAAWRADRAGDRALEAEVWIDVVFVVGSKLREREAGLRWAQFARAQLEQTAEDPRLSARLEYYVALLQGALGHDREAYAGFQVAERYQRRAYDADDWRFATTYGAQASALSRLGRSEESFVMYRRAIDTMQRTLGPNHPSNGPLLNNYATALRRAGRLDEARRYFEQALAIKRQTLGEDHPSVAITIANLAEIQQRLGNYGEAADLYRQAREMRGRTLGESHSSYLTSVSCESSLALQRGDVPEATALAERALRGYEAQGEAYPIAQAETAYGEVLYRAGRASEAEPVLRRALAVYESTDVEPEPTAYPRTRLGAVLVELGRPAEAIEMLEAAERARGDRDLDPEERALTQYALGRALFESETDPLRGYRLVQQAEARFAQAGPPGEWALERVRGWLASHPEPMPLEVRN
ncbi:MAG: tetratricopeptide repeat protein, partial [Sandaracinaceae bacterium]